ncbi:uncharacterized protein [Henckelia pumila]|uniref:uncharacterized protein isoform X1 n=2 Tax=Henckelia pumila TaxID=405737 RepID=UPI003C6DEEFD
MKAMVVKKSWFSSILEQREVKKPKIKDDEIMIKVSAAGVNRGDIIDVVASDEGVCPGLECAGIIEAVGRNVNCCKVGDKVCAILEGGGYAEKVAVPANLLLPLPDIDLEAAAGLPYASCSIWSALFEMCDPKTLKDKKILIHEGANGIGALAIQYAKHMGLTVIASTGSRDMFSMCRDYGADFCFDNTSTNFVEEVVGSAGCLGVDFVLDYGASNLRRNIECCCTGGKVVIVELHGKECGRIDLARLQQHHTEITVFDLQSRDLDYKASVIAEVRTHLWPAILEKKVIPAVGNRFAMIEAQKALDLLKKNDGTGKIILYMDFEKTSGHLKGE